MLQANYKNATEFKLDFQYIRSTFEFEYVRSKVLIQLILKSAIPHTIVPIKNITFIGLYKP